MFTINILSFIIISFGLLTNNRRVDSITVAPGWDRLKEISAEEGLVAAGYERKYAEYRSHLTTHSLHSLTPLTPLTHSTHSLHSLTRSLTHSLLFSRLYQFIKIYLFAPASAVFDCPLSMTDGAARLLELHGDDKMKSV